MEHAGHTPLPSLSSEQYLRYGMDTVPGPNQRGADVDVTDPLHVGARGLDSRASYEIDPPFRTFR